MEDLLNKDHAIQYIYCAIVEWFGNGYFVLPDFWDGDNCAIGLIKNGKLIYISSWDFIDHLENDFRFYAEFELIDSVSLETIKVEKVLNNITKEELMMNIKDFVGEGGEN
jgi:hypothetical protein